MNAEMAMRIVVERQSTDAVVSTADNNNASVIAAPVVVHETLFWTDKYKEIVWEELPSSTGRHRIAIYGLASDNNNRVPILTLALPEETLPPTPPSSSSSPTSQGSNSMAMCTIEQQPVLACLVAPDSIIVWTLEKSTTLFPPEGWQIHLPFDCVAIFGCSKGLILQRAVDEEEYNQALSSSSTFFYQNSNNNNNNAVLFSWHHPLQEMLPIIVTEQSSSSSSSPPPPPQSVVWVGDIQDQTYMVTFRNRSHAIYRIGNTPVIPETPLHVQLPMRYETKQSLSNRQPQPQQHFLFGDEANTDLSFLEHNNLDDVDVEEDYFWNNVSNQKINHQQALAEALLGNTPTAAARSQHQHQQRSSITMRNNSQHNPFQSQNHPKRSNEYAVNNFWSPSPTHSHHLLATTSFSNHYHAQHPHQHLSNTLLPRLQIEPVYTLPGFTQRPSSHIFATSTALGLLVPMMERSPQGSNYLLLWQPKTTQTSTAVNSNSTTPQAVVGGNINLDHNRIDNVRMAQPIEVVPGMAKGILVWHNDGALKLYRDDFVTWPIAPCYLDVSPKLEPIHHFESCRDRIRFHIVSHELDRVTRTMCMGRLTLTVQDGVTENVLTACDAALDHDIGAWKLRASVQVLGGDWNAFRSVVWNMVLYETRAQKNVDSLKKSPTTTITTTKPTSQPTAWEQLLDSEYHHQHGKMLWDSQTDLDCSSSRRSFPYSKSATSLPVIEYLNHCTKGRPIFSVLFDSMHLLYEDAKLSLHSNVRQLLGEFLADLCHFLVGYNEKAGMFLQYYKRDIGLDAQLEDKTPKPSHLQNTFMFTSFQSPPSILLWLERMMRRFGDNSRRMDEPFSFDTPNVINAACTKTLSIIRIFSILFDESQASNPNRDRDVVLAMVEHGFSSSQAMMQEFSPGVSLALLEVIHRCRYCPTLLDVEKSGWTAAALELVGRQDLSLNINGGEHNSKVNSFATEDELADSSVTGSFSELDEDKDGLVLLERSAIFLFPNDNRVHEAARLLRSSRPMFLRVERALEVSDHEYEKQKQKRLMELSIRSLALPIGRGMLTIGNFHPVPAEMYPLPELCLKGRVPPTNATMRLDISECAPDMPVWPEFHNGVAAGLRLPLHNEKERPGLGITRTWILYNRPPEKCESDAQGDERPAHVKQAYSHGGFLLALGLRGHLTALDMSDFYEYLTQGTVTTTVGVLLGLAANRRGSCDISVSKMLCLHIPSLIPQHFSAIDVASTVQAAAIVGAGLLYQRSSHRMMTEFLLNEIGKRPDTDMSTFEREAYTLSCGLALGTVNLCLGDKENDDTDRAAGLADLHMEERLLRYIIGGVDRDESRRARETNDRFSLPTNIHSNDNEKCSTVWECDFVNTGVTCPGATLALGMMYMKTENKTIASALALPNTHFLLEFVRPDFLGLRVISRSLILWNEVQPTSRWIHDQIPAVVQDAYRQIRSTAKLAHGIKSPTAGHVPKSKQGFDRRAVRQMYAHIVAGSCFSVGLRFAGTKNREAKTTLIDFLRDFHILKEANDPVSVASRPETSILDNCLGTIAISLALVLAGSGDLDALRWLKILRWRCDRDTKYGSYMIYGMAIGILFLGGGTCTIGREPEDIAALLTALFPRYPLSTTDNQFHLQALRHLYALAVKRRELRAIDIDTGGKASVQVEITTDRLPPYNFCKLNVPCLLHNSDSTWKELRIVSDEYFPLRTDMSQIEKNDMIFYVKKCSGMLSQSRRHLQLVSGKNGDVVPQSTLQLVQSLTNRPLWNGLTAVLSANKDEMELLSRALLYCLAADSEDAFLSLYLRLWNSVRCFSCKGCTSDNIDLVWTMRLIRVYYHHVHPRIQSSPPSGAPPSLPLLDTNLLLPYLQELLERRLLRPPFQEIETERLARTYFETA
jgi:anaphase-promoting complex subunit 1